MHNAFSTKQRSSISHPHQKICLGLLPWKIDNGLPSLSLSLPHFTLARRYIGSSLLTMACQQKNEDATWSQQQPEAWEEGTPSPLIAAALPSAEVRHSSGSGEPGETRIPVHATKSTSHASARTPLTGGAAELSSVEAAVRDLAVEANATTSSSHGQPTEDTRELTPAAVPRSLKKTFEDLFGDCSDLDDWEDQKRKARKNSEMKEEEEPASPLRKPGANRALRRHWLECLATDTRTTDQRSYTTTHQTTITTHQYHHPLYHHPAPYNTGDNSNLKDQLKKIIHNFLGSL